MKQSLTSFFVHYTLQTDASADQLAGQRNTLCVTASGLKHTVCTEDKENRKISIPTQRSSTALHLGNLLAALADSIAELGL